MKCSWSEEESLEDICSISYAAVVIAAHPSLNTRAKSFVATIVEESSSEKSARKESIF